MGEKKGRWSHCRAVGRSNNNGNANGGLSYANTNNAFSNSNTNNGARLTTTLSSLPVARLTSTNRPYGISARDAEQLRARDQSLSNSEFVSES